MREPPDDLTTHQLAAYLGAGWGIDAVDVRYAPVGHGSHNWTATDADRSKWFIKTNPVGPNSAFFQATYRTAAALHAQGLDFVQAAIPDRSGEYRRRVSPRWEMAVFPFINGRNPDLHTDERVQLAHVVGRLHAFTPIPEVALWWTPGYLQPELRQILADELGRAWDGGPYGETARARFVDTAWAIERLLDHHDRLAAQLADSDDPCVMTHGEPHDGNSMLDSAGNVHLVDCDAVMVAPRERDLRLILHGSHGTPIDWDNTDVLAAYQQAAGPVQPRPFVLELFRAAWHLMEICRYAQLFGQPHDDSGDVRLRWTSLQSYLRITQNWPEIA